MTKISEKEIPALKGISSLRKLWQGPGLLDVEADMFPARGVMDRPLETLSQFELLAGLYAAAIHNITIRDQLDSLRRFGRRKEEMDDILSSCPEFEYRGHFKQDQTEGCVYVLPDGNAYLKECSTDPVFRLKGEKDGMEMRADGSRARRFPEILVVCMESTKRPMGFVWRGDLRED